eukprot:TRINITY_DN93030_c0_g1_i1.p1 TRINITY_DN93030_c0_g1~~TRINITY_DN93030_c0_g1_i1.p1  ORF type:complete len:1237 (+),score=253.42 TRINITY_DN93030_c0_g1_i1:23-3733(+)
MPISPVSGLAGRTAFGAFLASLLTIVPSLRCCFSPEVQPLLPATAVLALFCAGGSLEETIGLTCQLLYGTGFAVLIVQLGLWSTGFQNVSVTSWQSVAVLADASLLTCITCLLPAAENIKVTAVGLTSYFMVAAVFPKSMSTQSHFLGIEYFIVTLVGCAMMVFAYACPMPGTPSTQALPQAAAAVEAVADGCAELIGEATAAFLGRGAGEAWVAIARHKLQLLESQLAEAERSMEHFHWSAEVIALRLQQKGRVKADLCQSQREAALLVARDALSSCKLLCELAMVARDYSDREEAVTARSVAAERLTRVASGASELLRDIVRTNFKIPKMNEDLEELLSNAAGGPRRRRLRRTARAALRDSSAAASELLMLGLFGGANTSELSRLDFARTRADMSAFFFLVHALATDMLSREGEALCTVKAAVDGAKPLVPDEEEVSDVESNPSSVASQEFAKTLSSMYGMLSVPLIQRQRSMSLEVHVPARGHRLKEKLFRLPDEVAVLVHQCWDSVKLAMKLRGRFTLKVTLTFAIAFALSIYCFNLDGTVVSTVAYLSSYGSQYTGGSLRRALQRALGIAVGSTIGSCLRKINQSIPDLNSNDVLALDANLMAVSAVAFAWVYAGMLISFEGGKYSYAGFCAAFTGMKFLITPDISFDTTVLYSMYACLLAAAIELGVLPVDAEDLMRSRLAASTAGSTAILSALVSVDPRPVGRTISSLVSLDDGVVPSPSKSVNAGGGAITIGGKIGLETVKEHECTTISDLPDLTERLKEAGLHSKYLAWREGYMRWRQGDARGSHGELKSGEPVKEQKAALEPQQVFARTSTPADEVEVAFEAAFAPKLGATDSSNGVVLDAVSGVELPAERANFLKVAPPCENEGARYSLGSEDLQSMQVDLGTDGLASIQDATHSMLQAMRDHTLSEVSVAAVEQHLAPVELDPSAAAEHPLLAELLHASLQAVEEDNEEACYRPQEDPASTETILQTMTLSEVQLLLEEMQSALAPTADLADQAAERLIGDRVDPQSWRSLADSLEHVWLKLTLLSRVALRLRRGVNVAALLGGSDSGAAARELVTAFGTAMATATVAIAGGSVPTHQTAANLESQLRDCCNMLLKAMASREPSHNEDKVGISAEILAGVASSTLMGLLLDVSKVVASAVALAGCKTPAGTGEAVTSAEAQEEVTRASQRWESRHLPDLTDRLKEEGAYEQYVKWREGYLKWRSGEARGAHGEIVSGESAGAEA